MEKSSNQWKDTLGILASVTCAIHCAATPILLAFLPALKFTEMMASPRFHQIAAVVCVGMVTLAIWPAFRRFRDYRVLSLSLAGVGLLITAAFFLPDACCTQTIGANSASDPHAGHNHGSHNYFAIGHASHNHSEITLASMASPELVSLIQPWMTPLGGLLLVVAHGLNLRLRVCTKRSCRCDSSSSTVATGSSNVLHSAANSNAAQQSQSSVAELVKNFVRKY